MRTDLMCPVPLSLRRTPDPGATASLQEERESRVSDDHIDMRDGPKSTKRVLVLHSSERLGPRIFSEIRSLARRCRVCVVAWTRMTSASNLALAGVEFHQVNLKAPEGHLRILLRLPRLYRMLLRDLRHEQADVIHCTHLMLLPIAILLARRLDAEVVYDVFERHSATMARYSPFPRLTQKLIEVVEHVMVRRVWGVLTVDSPADYLRARYARYNARVQVLFNVPDLREETLGSETRPAVPPTGGERVVAYVGGLSRAKGVEMALRAIDVVRRSVDSVRLLLVGPFRDSQQALVEMIDGLDLSGHVRVLEWMPYDEMLSHLEKAELGLALHQPLAPFRLVAKGTGRKFFTYMQAGLPIVGPTFASVGDIVRETGCGLLVDTTNLDEIVGAILRLLEDPSYARELGVKGRRAVESAYNWGVEEKRLLDFYDGLIAS